MSTRGGMVVVRIPGEYNQMIKHYHLEYGLSLAQMFAQFLEAVAQDKFTLIKPGDDPNQLTMKDI